MQKRVPLCLTLCLTAVSISVAASTAVPPPGAYDVRDYGAAGDGVTDDSAAVAAALAAASAADGGVIFFPPGTYRINSQISIPNDGASPPVQKSLRLTGAGPSHSGGAVSIYAGAPLGGSILDLRYGGPGAKIQTLGLGFLELDRLTLKDDGNDAAPFLLATNTTVQVQSVEFHGNPQKSGATCDQDAIILGGTGTDLWTGGANAPFQGYGSVIRGNYFNHIRRGVWLRTYANGVVIEGNTWWQNTGSNLPGGAAIELQGIPSDFCSGNYVTGNIVEMGGYEHAVTAAYSIHNVLVGNGWYDAGSRVVSFVHFGTAAIQNLLVDGFHADLHPGMTEAAAGTNTFLSSHQSQPSLFPERVILTSPTVLNDSATGVATEDPAGNRWIPLIGGSTSFRLTVTPAGGTLEDVSADMRYSPTRKGLQLYGTDESSLFSPLSQLLLLSADGQPVVIGDASQRSVMVLDGVLTSTKPTGTAPLQVASTTPVPNLTVTRGEDFRIGDGDPITRVMTAVAMLDFRKTGKQSSTDRDLPVPGAEPGDVVSVGVPKEAMLPGSVYTAWVSGHDTVTIRLFNGTKSQMNPPQAEFRVMVTRF